MYPYQVKTAADYLGRIGLPDFHIAAVATGFPSGQYSLESRLKEIDYAIENGAKEIDIVINRTLALEGKWKGNTWTQRFCFNDVIVSNYCVSA